ncbi:uncharacterized protein LOC124359045 [Homalodisca vitripennis]|uniref:Protein quiver n=1 Tax=Homalodisca liturata TaxID=320908 RepID=A0A1B6JH96_9HEMI|nr:uncharacterized protein LOC124359044 [Homalodisca vitripennis]XP_046667397.1 uncharacterized protein LOC124359045 [Homalodisca vitripennis]
MEAPCTAWTVMLIVVASASISGEFISDQHHQTDGAKVKKLDLWCYKCDTMDDGDRCSNLSSGDESKLVYKCPEHRTICMVKRYSYTTSTENSTSVQRMWSLERNCTHRCEPGCIVIGERTKLYACTACCERSLCNTGRGSATALSLDHLVSVLTVISVLPKCL